MAGGYWLAPWLYPLAHKGEYDGSLRCRATARNTTRGAHPQSPAKNLVLPPYKFVFDTKIQIG